MLKKETGKHEMPTYSFLFPFGYKACMSLTFTSSLLLVKNNTKNLWHRKIPTCTLPTYLSCSYSNEFRLCAYKVVQSL